MDDDQGFVDEIVQAIENSEYADYHTFNVERRDEGRDATVTITLVAGDRYRITLEEIHD